MSGLELRLPRAQEASGEARRFVEHHLVGRGSPAQLDDVKLITSELVENAVLHGAGQITLSLHDTPEGIRVEVTDQGEGAAIKIRRQGPELGGWGLRLVDQLSERWGAYEGTTHVWAVVRLDSPIP